MENLKIYQICERALIEYGDYHQVVKAIEEFSELIQALAKWHNAKNDLDFEKTDELKTNVSEEDSRLHYNAFTNNDNF